MTTLADVARRAGVTAATVSYVLSNKVAVRASTRERVLAAVAELGYQPNLLAQSMATGKTMTIGVIVPTIANPFFASAVEAMERRARAEDYDLVLAVGQGDEQLGKQHLDRLGRRWVDGYVVMGGGVALADLRPIQATGKPLVLSIWDDVPSDLVVARVDIDFEQVGELATMHLVGLGHTRIASIFELPIQSSRATGYRRVLQAAGVRPHPGYLETGDSTFASGVRAMQRLFTLPEQPTAVVAGNDLMAMGALEAAYQAGIAVPEAVSIIGVDDIPLAAHTHPPLTTIRVPVEAMATETMATVLTQISATASVPPPVWLPSHLVPRASTGPCHSG